MVLLLEMNSVYQCTGRDDLHRNNKNPFIISVNNVVIGDCGNGRDGETAVFSHYDLLLNYTQVTHETPQYNGRNKKNVIKDGCDSSEIKPFSTYW